MVRVVVVDDSAVCRSALRETLEADGDIRVVGEAVDGKAALTVVTREKPQLVTMDLQMPGASGFEAIEEIMAKVPVPILVITGQSRGSSAAAFEAIRRGALQLAEKPPPGPCAAAIELRAQVRLLAKVPVVRHVAGSRDKGARAVAAPPTARTVAQVSLASMPPLIGIAASAGGPGAIAALLGQFAPSFTGCLAVVQHLPKGFAASFVDFLRTRTALRVKLVGDSATREAGTVFVAPDDRHLVVTSKNQLRAVDSPPVGGFRPSATVLFQSMADVLGPVGIGVVLSGMGTDGADGLLRMRREGSLTIAQDEATSAVFGMPRAAAERGAASLVLPLAKIAEAVISGAPSKRLTGPST
jgi:two-component system, chemotaxis family, protein-glutamate methylesterase/glutaminase